VLPGAVHGARAAVLAVFVKPVSLPCPQVCYVWTELAFKCIYGSTGDHQRASRTLGKCYTTEPAPSFKSS
jgi:hypothetical protein